MLKCSDYKLNKIWQATARIKNHYNDAKCSLIFGTALY